METRLNQETTMVDFDKSAMNAISKHFPGTKIRSGFWQIFLVSTGYFGTKPNVPDNLLLDINYRTK